MKENWFAGLLDKMYGKYIYICQGNILLVDTCNFCIIAFQ